MFTIKDLVKIDNKGMQELLKHINSKSLMLALKGTPDAIVSHFLTNLSTRAQNTLKEDMDALSKTKLSDINEKQQEIDGLAKKLSDEGKILIRSDDEKYI